MAGSDYDVIVVGGGHAGIEAAHAAARLGAHTALVTLRRAAVGRMSCNPAIGGQAKGQMVREIDALGGVMGLATDAAGIQFRVLNRSHGPAVWGPRAQCDKARYAAWTQHYLAGVPGLDVLEASVERLLVEHGQVVGVASSLGDLRAQAVVITTGTFLRGLMHTGERQTAGGRVGEAAAVGLSASLAELGLELGRLKTGTPPRVLRDSVDFSACEPQPGDDPPVLFSFLHAAQAPPLPQVCCHITHTVPAVHELIRANLHRAPMYSGQIQSVGPRYCPSIEDKVVKFADKSTHHIFLEPEGLDTDWVYCNGISTSLPAEVQDEIVRLIPGLERARIVQHGYAVEYDYVPPHQVGLDLQTKRVAGLFLAGQINGTSGYEEAAGQGLVAGLNAARWARAGAAGFEPFILGRHEAYIGVMIDDLVTRPPIEPYRMFSSRAEFRLSLRSDNADLRLTARGRQAGLVTDERWAVFTRKREQVTALRERLARVRVEGKGGLEALRNPNASLADVLAADPAGPADAAVFPPDVRDAVRTDALYAGYLERQAEQVARLASIEDKPIPRGFDFERVVGLGREARQRLTAVGPATLGQASRISGITPADVTVLLMALKAPRAGA